MRLVPRAAPCRRPPCHKYKLSSRKRPLPRRSELVCRYLFSFLSPPTLSLSDHSCRLINSFHKLFTFNEFIQLNSLNLFNEFIQSRRDIFYISMAFLFFGSGISVFLRFIWLLINSIFFCFVKQKSHYLVIVILWLLIWLFICLLVINYYYYYLLISFLTRGQSSNDNYYHV